MKTIFKNYINLYKNITNTFLLDKFLYCTARYSLNKAFEKISHVICKINENNCLLVCYFTALGLNFFFYKSIFKRKFNFSVSFFALFKILLI